MKDVARLASVSQSTVSRAINFPDRLDGGTLRRVTDAIGTLGYVPDGIARSLRTQRSQTIGMCIPTLGFALFGETVETVQAALRTASYTLLLSVTGYDAAQELTEVSAMVRRGIDGIVLVGGQHDPALFALLRSRGIPYVIVWSVHQDHPSIGFDHRRAMIRLTTHLIELGHRRIATVMSSVQHNDRIRSRLLGVGDALAAHDLPFPAEYQRVTQTGLKSAAATADELLGLPVPPTAIACVNDVIAAGVMAACHRRRLHVPRDISITGFSEQEFGEIQAPALTTVRTPIAPMGERAAAFLLDRIKGLSTELHEEIPTELIIRGSTGPVATVKIRKLRQ